MKNDSLIKYKAELGLILMDLKNDRITYKQAMDKIFQLMWFEKWEKKNDGQ